MKFFGSPLTVVIATLIGTIIGAIISAIILGTAHIIDFSWILLMLGCVMLVILAASLLLWYKSIRAIQAQYEKDAAAMKKDKSDFKEEMRKMIMDEIQRSNEWKISFANQVSKEHRDRSEELKRQCMEAISGAESRMDSSLKNTQSILTNTVKSYEGALESQKHFLIADMQPKLEALEERLRKELMPVNKE
jgi:biopolymer transport protein ExbB/TolQ